MPRIALLGQPQGYAPTGLSTWHSYRVLLRGVYGWGGVWCIPNVFHRHFWKNLCISVSSVLSVCYIGSGDKRIWQIFANH